MHTYTPYTTHANCGVGVIHTKYTHNLDNSSRGTGIHQERDNVGNQISGSHVIAFLPTYRDNLVQTYRERVYVITHVDNTCIMFIDIQAVTHVKIDRLPHYAETGIQDIQKHVIESIASR
jgi:hypothetical protein